MWRTDPTANEIRTRIDDGALGNIWSFDATWFTSQVALRDPSHWLFDSEIAGAGILAWLGCHWIDLMQFMLGDVACVSAMVASRSPYDIDVEDIAEVILQLNSKAMGTIRTGYVHKPFGGYHESDLNLSFHGELGSIYWPPKTGKYLLRSGHRASDRQHDQWVETQRPLHSDEAGYGLTLLRSFVDAALTHSGPPVTQDHALRVLRVVEAAVESSRTGEHIQLSGEQ